MGQRKAAGSHRNAARRGGAAGGLAPHLVALGGSAPRPDVRCAAAEAVSRLCEFAPDAVRGQPGLDALVLNALPTRERLAAACAATPRTGAALPLGPAAGRGGGGSGNAGGDSHEVVRRLAESAMSVGILILEDGGVRQFLGGGGGPAARADFTARLLAAARDAVELGNHEPLVGNALGCGIMDAKAMGSGFPRILQAALERDLAAGRSGALVSRQAARLAATGARAAGGGGAAARALLGRADNAGMRRALDLARCDPDKVPEFAGLCCELVREACIPSMVDHALSEVPACILRLLGGRRYAAATDALGRVANAGQWTPPGCEPESEEAAWSWRLGAALADADGGALFGPPGAAAAAPPPEPARGGKSAKRGKRASAAPPPGGLSMRALEKAPPAAGVQLLSAAALFCQQSLPFARAAARCAPLRALLTDAARARPEGWPRSGWAECKALAAAAAAAAAAAKPAAYNRPTAATS
ncbi:MAG: hypothetical protein J3K34DRAFT_465018 [Monoraphidium minutum]|nr:MAG: hypothetical protein J3K34DRAFT_465018 [Monoraphidium minutum]